MITFELESNKLFEKINLSKHKDLILSILSIEFNPPPKLKGVEATALREAADQLRNKINNAIIVLVSVSGEKIPTVVAISKDTKNMDARNIMKHLVSQLGGNGGGRPDLKI